MSIVNVAKAAGVSIATVSRVLNGVPGVNPKMVAQVNAAVEEMNFVPRQSKKTPAKLTPTLKLKTGTIGVLTLGHAASWLERPVLARAFSGIRRGCEGIGGRILLGESIDRDSPGIRLTSRDVDGVVVFVSSMVSAADCKHVYELIKQHVPVVRAMGFDNGVPGIDHVGADNHGIGQLAYSFLRERKCKSVAFITEHPQWPMMRTRFQSFWGVASEDDVVPSVYAVAPPSMNLAPFGPKLTCTNSLEELVHKVIDDSDHLEGLFFENDDTCLKFYQLLAAQRADIWKRFHIISCDNIKASIAALDPNAASIDIGAEEIGFRAVTRLFNRIMYPDSPSVLLTVRARVVL